MNKAIIIGNLTKDIELRKTNSNKSVTEFSVAVNEGYGEKKTTEFINCVAWEKTAELLDKFCGKGMKVMIDGAIKTDTYEKNGQKIYKTYVLVQNIEFLSRAEKETDKSGASNPKLDGIEITSEDLPFYGG